MSYGNKPSKQSLSNETTKCQQSSKNRDIDEKDHNVSGVPGSPIIELLFFFFFFLIIYL